MSMYNPINTLSDNIRIDKNKCITCGICVERCVLDNIRIMQAPCSSLCPLELNVQGYVQLCARGEFKAALDVIYEKLPFPGIIGRICSHPCETKCNRNNVDNEAVAIRALKRFLFEQEINLGPDLSVSEQKNESVAIIGTGPAGMMAAWDLRKAGYHVTMFERSARPGGILTQSIPEFRLPLEITTREFNYLVGIGVETHFNTNIGVDIAFDEILNKFDSVFLAIGLSSSKYLGVEGEGTTDNTLHAIEFLSRARNDLEKLKVGEKVVVIGGGDVAIDAAHTALRAGARDVCVVSLEQRDEMPALRSSIIEAETAGINFEDGWGPLNFIIDKGSVDSIIFRKCVCVYNEDGQFSPKFEDEKKMNLAADTVIIAIGQSIQADFLKGSGVLIKGGTIHVNPFTLQTSNPMVFAGGDVIAGPSSVVHAMADGRKAAVSIMRMLQGNDIEFERDYRGPYVHDFEVDYTKAFPGRRVNLKNSPLASDNDLRTSLEKSVTVEMANKEAKRCVNCGHPSGYYRTCWLCLPCEIECPYDALHVDIPYIIR